VTLLQRLLGATQTGVFDAETAALSIASSGNRDGIPAVSGP
jgi:hypothetical protein